MLDEYASDALNRKVVLLFKKRAHVVHNHAIKRAKPTIIFRKAFVRLRACFINCPKRVIERRVKQIDARCEPDSAAKDSWLPAVLLAVLFGVIMCSVGSILKKVHASSQPVVGILTRAKSISQDAFGIGFACAVKPVDAANIFDCHDKMRIY